MSFAGRVAAVTGASRGIGEAIAFKLAREGVRLSLCARSEADLNAVAEEIATFAERPLAQVVDVQDLAQLRAFIMTTHETLGRLDLLVNNAGALRGKPLLEVSEEDWDVVLDTNLKAMFFGTQFALPLMIAQGGGCIINISSVIGLEAAASPYAISKWGTIGLTKGFAKAFGAQGIRVNAVAPGITATAMMNYGPGDDLTRAATPLGRVCTPEEIADAVRFLASDEARMITGVVLVVDGGQRL